MWQMKCLIKFEYPVLSKAACKTHGGWWHDMGHWRNYPLLFPGTQWFTPLSKQRIASSPHKMAGCCMTKSLNLMRDCKHQKHMEQLNFYDKWHEKLLEPDFSWIPLRHRAPLQTFQGFGWNGIRTWLCTEDHGAVERFECPRLVNPKHG